MPKKNDSRIVYSKVMDEKTQSHDTRRFLFKALQKELGRAVVSFFTTFTYPAMISDGDADMLEGLLQKIDLTKGMALIINSPGGDGIEAERIINVCRAYAEPAGHWAIVPAKAKSAATMICFGAEKVFMSATSELGPVDPQIALSEGGQIKRFSVYNIVTSYEDLFKKAVGEKEGNLQPYLQQLQHYDEREITEFKSALDLSEDIAVRTLESGMMKGISKTDIKKNIHVFLSPKRKKIHERPIYRDEAENSGIKVEKLDGKSKLWQLVYELYVRTQAYMGENFAKCIESEEHSFVTPIKKGG